jgi:hypothetical protein
MKGEAQMTGPEVARVLATRVALGVGLGRLLGNRLSRQERTAAGVTLLLTGAVLAGTIAFEIFGRPRAFTMRFGMEGVRGAPSDTENLLRQRSGFTAE